ncbi:MAG: hypothetical protein JWP99_992, partial [Devosia sp.]|nr:hypothetical protein [Devosia sp.]
PKLIPRRLRQQSILQKRQYLTSLRRLSLWQSPCGHQFLPTLCPPKVRPQGKRPLPLLLRHPLSAVGPIGRLPRPRLPQRPRPQLHQRSPPGHPQFRRSGQARLPSRGRLCLPSTRRPLPTPKAPYRRKISKTRHLRALLMLRHQLSPLRPPGRPPSTPTLQSRRPKLDRQQPRRRQLLQPVHRLCQVLPSGRSARYLPATLRLGHHLRSRQHLWQLPQTILCHQRRCPRPKPSPCRNHLLLAQPSRMFRP